MEDIVDVTTKMVLQDLEDGKNFQVILKVVPTEGTNGDFLKRYPNGFERSYDHKTIAEAYQTLVDINERVGLQKPPVPTAEETKEVNDRMPSEVFIR